MHRAAVIGLGNIGFQLNLDPKRTITWSHVAAYEKCKKTELCGAVEIDDRKIEAFTRMHGSVPVYKTVEELMLNVKPDVVSICTGTASHCGILKSLCSYPLKAIFCEKPLAATIDEARTMVDACTRNNIVFAVNHTRRWDVNYLHARKLIQEGKIGRIKAAHAFYPGQVFNMGTHLMDAVRMLVEKKAKRISGMSFNLDNVDPSVSGFLEFEDDICCSFASTGKREDMIFEIDVIGDEGRLRVIENGSKIELFAFADSKRYSGYRELEPRPVVLPPERDRFVDAVDDICSVIEGRKPEVNCSGRDGMVALVLSISMLESAMHEGKPAQIHEG